MNKNFTIKKFDFWVKNIHFSKEIIEFSDRQAWIIARLIGWSRTFIKSAREKIISDILNIIAGMSYWRNESVFAKEYISEWEEINKKIKPYKDHMVQNIEYAIVERDFITIQPGKKASNFLEKVLIFIIALTLVGGSYFWWKKIILVIIGLIVFIYGLNQSDQKWLFDNEGDFFIWRCGQWFDELVYFPPLLHKAIHDNISFFLDGKMKKISDDEIYPTITIKKMKHPAIMSYMKKQELWDLWNNYVTALEKFFDGKTKELYFAHQL